MTFEEFGALVDTIRMFFPKETFLEDEKVGRAWYEVLKDLDIRRTRDGMMEYVKTNNFTPSIADIMKYHDVQPKYTQKELAEMIAKAEERQKREHRY